MKFVLEVLSLTFLATVGATTGDDTEGPEEQQQIYQQYGQTTLNNGIDTNMLLMMAVINHNQMNKMINMISMITKNGSCVEPNPPTKQLQNSTECGSAKPRIVGGEDTVENGIPWQCNFYYSDGTWYECGGTIINCDPTIIVTSAWCLDYHIAPAKVTCGDWKIDATDANEHTLEVTEVILHPLYNRGGVGNDIAVVKVNGMMPCSKGKIWPACLPNNQVKYTYEGWTDTMVSGWGVIKSTSDYSNTLKFVTVPLVSDDICKNNAEFPEFYENHFVPEEMICAGMADKGVCWGDSGSPLVTRAIGDPGYSLIGIVSWEWGCAESPEPYAVYTDFANYLSWVADQFEMIMTT